MELNKENMRKILFVICFSMLLFWGLNHLDTVFNSFQTLLEILFPFLLGLCLAFIINVLMRPIEKLWDACSKNPSEGICSRIKRPICLLLSTLIIAGAIFILFFMVVPELQHTLAMIIEMFPDYVMQLTTWWTDLSVFLSQYSIVLPQPEFNFNEIGKMIGSFLTESGYTFFNKTVGLTATIFSAVFNGVLAMVFAAYILLEKEKLGGQAKRFLHAYLPAEKVQGILDVAALTNKTFSNFVTGQLTEAIIIGVLCFIGMSVLKMPYAPMISVLVGFTALIPVFGAFFGTIVGAFLILMVEPIKALWFVLFIIVLQQFEGDLIYPRVVGKSVSLPGIWVLAAVTIGGNAFGMLGMLVGVPVCSVLYSLTKLDVYRRLEEKKAAEQL